MSRVNPVHLLTLSTLALCISYSLGFIKSGSDGTNWQAEAKSERHRNNLLWEMLDQCRATGVDNVGDVAKKLKRTKSLMKNIEAKVNEQEQKTELQKRRTETLENQVKDQKEQIHGLKKEGDEKDSKIKEHEQKINGHIESLGKLESRIKLLESLRYKDCGDVQELNPGAPSGVYTVHTGTQRVATRVYCDMDTQQGGWTTILRRFDGSVSFNLGWSNLQSQIGKLAGEHWIGLDAIHSLTSQGKYELLVELKGHTESVFACYDRFWIEGNKSWYKLHVSGYNKRSTVGDGLAEHNGYAFSTRDADHDTRSTESTAQLFQGAWWYTFGHKANLLATYRYTKENRGVVTTYADSMAWYFVNSSHYYALKAASMKVRRV